MLLFIKRVNGVIHNSICRSYCTLWPGLKPACRGWKTLFSSVRNKDDAPYDGSYLRLRQILWHYPPLTQPFKRLFRALLSHQAWGASWLQEGWGVHEVLPLLHIEQGQAWGSCGRRRAYQVDRNKAHSVPVLLHKASFQLAIKQPKQRAFYERCTLTSFSYSTDTA